jgi:tRNA threonylcarbamoyladenosine modification (KEOPS) complex Cgi121 subunit
MKVKNRIYKVGNTFTTVIGVSALDKEYAIGIIEGIRKTSGGAISIQAVSADAAYGIDHILQALKISIESQSRKILLASTLEMDLLLRISCTNQILIALRQIGLKNQASGCFIVFSKNKKKLLEIARLLDKMDFKIDDHVLEPSKAKKELICKRLGVQLNEFLLDQVVFTSFLAERAALLTK